MKILRSWQVAVTHTLSTALKVCPLHKSPTNETRSRHKFSHWSKGKAVNYNQIRNLFSMFKKRLKHSVGFIKYGNKIITFTYQLLIYYKNQFGNCHREKNLPFCQKFNVFLWLPCHFKTFLLSLCSTSLLHQVKTIIISWNVY